MKTLFFIGTGLLLANFCSAQQVYQIRADSVRIYNTCDTAELILENRTQDTSGFLFNKGRGRTEFRKIKLSTVGSDAIAIEGQDTLNLNPILDKFQSSPKNIYTSDGILSGTRKLTGNQRSYGLAFDSLTNFSVGANLVALVGKNPMYSNGITSFVVQGGQSNWRAFSDGGTATTDLQIGPGSFRATAEENELRVNGSSSGAPGIILSGAVHMDLVVTFATSYTIGIKGYFVAANSLYNSVTVNLPNSTFGRILVIKKVNAANSVTVAAAAGNTIEGQTSVVLMDNGAVLRLIGNGGAGWYTY